MVGNKTLVGVTAAQPLNPTSLGATGSAQAPVMLDPKTVVDLTSHVDSQGLLHWSVPSGHWILFGFWQRPTGQVPQTLTGIASSRTLDQVPPLPEPAMLLVDPFSHTSADAALAKREMEATNARAFLSCIGHVQCNRSTDLFPAEMVDDVPEDIVERVPGLVPDHFRDFAQIRNTAWHVFEARFVGFVVGCVTNR